MLLTMLDFEDRSLNGPVMKMDEFDLLVAKNIRQIVKKHSHIKFNPQELVVDDETADAVFQAAVEFCVETGVLNTDTQRIVKWTREEIEELVQWYRENPTTRTFGRGEEEHTVRPRTGEDPTPPVTWACVAGVIEPEWFIPYVEVTVREKIVKGLGISGGINAFEGIAPRAGAPSEILAGFWEQRALREGLRRAGRPNIHVGLIATVSTTGGTAAVLAQGLRQPYDSMIGVHIMPEQKINWERLNLATLCRELGYAPWISAMSMLGGLAGGPVGVAIAVTANFLEQLSIARGKLGSIFVSDLQGANTSREALWALSAALRAIGRNVGVATGSPANNTGVVFSQEEDVLRSAAAVTVLTASGGAYNWSTGKLPPDTRIQHQVMKAIAGLRRERANEILNRLFAKVEEMAKAGGEVIVPSRTFNFPNVYDVNTLKPKAEYIEQCRKAIEMLNDIGIPVPGDLLSDMA